MIKWLKTKFCNHEFHHYKPMMPIGVCMGWNLKPVVEYESFSACEKCGTQKNEKGWVFMRDDLLHPENYNEDGTPLEKFKLIN